jgi:hypothetical protein
VAFSELVRYKARMAWVPTNTVDTEYHFDLKILSVFLKSGFERTLIYGFCPRGVANSRFSVLLLNQNTGKTSWQ